MTDIYLPHLRLNAVTSIQLLAQEAFMPRGHIPSPRSTTRSGLRQHPFVFPSFLRGGALSNQWYSSDSESSIFDDQTEGGDNEYDTELEISDDANNADAQRKLRRQADSIIHSFELELVKLRKEMEMEAKVELLTFCENILQKRKAKLRRRQQRMSELYNVSGDDSTSNDF